ncbi:MAG: hypothetical protein GY820_14710 [Gammaproteobacteria bacterium]|nr:hypothetical protein [Gammaproteobacteria bacterium]
MNLKNPEKNPFHSTKVSSSIARRPSRVAQNSIRLFFLEDFCFYFWESFCWFGKGFFHIFKSNDEAKRPRQEPSSAENSVPGIVAVVEGEVQQLEGTFSSI